MTKKMIKLTLLNSEVINNNVLINTDKTDLWYIQSSVVYTNIIANKQEDKICLEDEGKSRNVEFLEQQERNRCFINGSSK